MLDLPFASPPVPPPEASQRTRTATLLSAVCIAATWICQSLVPHHFRLLYVSLAAATLLAAVGYTADPRPRSSGLKPVGNGRVLIRSLDDWMMYQYNVPFDRATVEQQSHALDHYKVGDRVFPARTQDQPPPNSPWQTIASLELLFPFVVITRLVRGWHLFYLFVALAASVQLLVWSLRRLSARRLEGAATPSREI